MKNEYEKVNQTIRIKAVDKDFNKHEILIDAECLDLLLEIDCEWKVRKDHNNYYAKTISRSTRQLLMHRVIMKAEKGSMIDHINHNGLDNRRKNLRFVTASENALNTYGAFSNNKISKLKNVYWVGSAKNWKASIVIKGVHILIGHFDDKYEAADAVQLYREKNVPSSTEFAASKGLVKWDEQLRKWV